MEKDNRRYKNKSFSFFEIKSTGTGRAQGYIARFLCKYHVRTQHILKT